MNGAIDKPAKPLTFTGGTLDRADLIRVDPDKLAHAWAHPDAKRVRLDGLDPVLGEGGILAREALPDDAALADHGLLGIEAGGAPLFVSLLKPQPVATPGFAPQVWQIVGDMRPEEAALYGAARSLADWHHRHPFCAACGQATAPSKGGWSRSCGSCGAEHFPRTDPVVIMLAEYGGGCCSGAIRASRPGRFSALAGFVEPGETIEEAVRRELFEEAGVRIGRVDYLMSQPWPFPSQLMIACHAEALNDELTLDTAEIAEAMWVNRDEVALAFERPDEARFLPPSNIAVAHHMLRHWLACPPA